MASNAELYYRKIFDGPTPAAYLETLTLVGEQENEWLEFKCADKIKDTQLGFPWSQALSGFANTAGGVLVWGINADRGTDGIDCANGLALTPDVDQFADKLNARLLSAVTPALQGVAIRAVHHTGKQGFVVCLIPEGQHKAYRAELADRQFYVRVRDNFIIPAASFIRSMFHPQISPNLVPRIWVVQEQPSGRFRFDISITNEGTATAEQMMALVELKTDNLFSALPVKELSRRLTVNAPYQIAWELERYLHPYMPPMMFAQYYLQSPAPPVDPLKFRLRLFSRNSPPSSWRCVVRHEDYRHKLTVNCVADDEPWTNQPEIPR